jgi:hypothetical protein
MVQRTKTPDDWKPDADDPEEPARKPDPHVEAILADERQTERQAPDDASPGEAAGS